MPSQLAILEQLIFFCPSQPWWDQVRKLSSEIFYRLVLSVFHDCPNEFNFSHDPLENFITNDRYLLYCYSNKISREGQPPFPDCWYHHNVEISIDILYQIPQFINTSQFMFL